MAVEWLARAGVLVGAVAQPAKKALAAAVASQWVVRVMVFSVFARNLAWTSGAG